MKRMLLCIVLLPLFWVPPSFAQEESFYKLSFQGIDHAYNMDFESALTTFDQIISLDAANPHGHLLKAISHYYLYLVDMSNKKAADTFLALANKTIEVAGMRLRQQGKDADALFYLGTINMYLAAYHGENNNWVRAYWFGKRGIGYLESVIQLNPEYYDAYLGLGLYHYYAAVMPKLIKAISSLLGVEADRLKGLKELQMAQEKGTFARIEAKFFLGYIYLYLEKDHKKGLALFKELATAYPENPVFQIVLGDAYRKVGKHDLAIAAYEKSVAERNYARFPRLVNSSYYLMGNIYYEKNEPEKAIEVYAKSVENAAKFPNRDDGIYSWGLFKQGECYEMLGDRAAAVNFYQRVHKSDNKYAYEKAQVRLKTPMLRIDYDLIRARNYMITRDFDAAIAVYESVLPQISNASLDYPLDRLPELFYNIGRAKYEKQAYAEAIKEFKKVLALKPIRERWIRPWTHYRLGKCYQFLGDVEHALKQYKLAYKFDDGELRFEIDKINRELEGSF